MSTPKYDVYYFIMKFAAIPEDLWCVNSYHDGDKHCAIGWCSESWNQDDPPSERRVLRALLDHRPGHINDGCDLRYQQPTPKKRILAALRDVACGQLQDDECE